MRTTLDLPDSLFKEVKTRAVQQGVKLKELLATYIEAGLRGSPASAKDLAPENARLPLPAAIERMPGTPLHPALTNAELYAMLEDEDIAEYHRVIAQSHKK